MRGIAQFLLPIWMAALNAGAAPLKAILMEEPVERGAAVKAIFESGGVLQVDAVTPSSTPVFERYKIVIVNVSEPLPMSTLTALDKYLMNGGGMVALAGTGSAFPDSAEANLMLGVTAATNRDQRAGPLWFYKDGNVAFDAATAGPAGKPIPPGKPILITIRNTEHPVTKGLPLEWMHLPDVLEGNLRGPGKNMTLLATAFSDSASGGTGRNEPQILTVMYGKGRVFHSVLGRTPEGLECVGLQTMLQRGAEWAATGRVTQKISADFPDDEKVSRRSLANTRALLK